mgnify:CR=1 FL=1
MKMNQYDIKYIKANYGSLKEYNKLKKEKMKRDSENFFREEQAKINYAFIASSTLESIRNGARARELKKQLEDIEFSMARVYSGEYNKWLLVYDLVNNSLHEIKKSLNKNKITLNDLQEVVKKCNEVHNIFNYDDIIEQLQYF